jgi:hypothetical protein
VLLVTIDVEGKRCNANPGEDEYWNPGKRVGGAKPNEPTDKEDCSQYLM